MLAKEVFSKLDPKKEPEVSCQNVSVFWVCQRRRWFPGHKGTESPTQRQDKDLGRDSMLRGTVGKGGGEQSKDINNILEVDRNLPKTRFSARESEGNRMGGLLIVDFKNSPWLLLGISFSCCAESRSLSCSH